MAFTLEHLRQLSVEDLETLKRIHGDTLSDREKAMIAKVIKEKETGESETDESETETSTEREQETSGTTEEDEPDKPPAWWKDPPSSDEIADKFLERLTEAEAVADQATRENDETATESSEETSAEKDTKDTEGGETTTRTKDEEPEKEHWFYRGKRKKVTSDS